MLLIQIALKIGKENALYFDKNKAGNKQQQVQKKVDNNVLLRFYRKAEGIAEGEHSSKIETAKNMLKAGLAKKIVAKYIGLSI